MGFIDSDTARVELLLNTRKEFGASGINGGGTAVDRSKGDIYQFYMPMKDPYPRAFIGRVVKYNIPTCSFTEGANFDAINNTMPYLWYLNDGLYGGWWDTEFGASFERRGFWFGKLDWQRGKASPLVFVNCSTLFLGGIYEPNLLEYRASPDGAEAWFGAQAWDDEPSNYTSIYSIDIRGNIRQRFFHAASSNPSFVDPEMTVWGFSANSDILLAASSTLNPFVGGIYQLNMSDNSWQLLLDLQNVPGNPVKYAPFFRQAQSYSPTVDDVMYIYGYTTNGPGPGGLQYFTQIAYNYKAKQVDFKYYNFTHGAGGDVGLADSIVYAGEWGSPACEKLS